MVATAYNRSSLAVGLEDESEPESRPGPKLVTLPIAARGVTTWTGADPFAFKRDRSSRVVSFLIHGIAIELLLILWGLASHQQIMQAAENFIPVDFKLYDPPPPVMPVAKVEGGGGGGGAHKIPPPPKAPLPKLVHIQTLAPQIIRVANPKLAMEPTLQVNMPENTTVPKLGMPDSPQVELASQGSGSHSGFGIGVGGGIGAGQSGGAGPGANGGFGGGVMTVGGGVSAPQVIHSAEPEFTDAARRADYQGTVSIQLIVDSQGNPQDIRIVRHLGMGLDEKAIEAVRLYKFKPATYRGYPVAVQLVIDVDFRLH